MTLNEVLKNTNYDVSLFSEEARKYVEDAIVVKTIRGKESLFIKGYGYPIFRMNEIHHSLCDLTTEKFVELSNEEFYAVKLNDRDVLFNRTNSFEKVGRTGVYYSCGIPQTFASYLVRLIPDNIHIYSEYLAAFLNTQYGIQEIRRRARQSINQCI